MSIYKIYFYKSSCFHFLDESFVFSVVYDHVGQTCSPPGPDQSDPQRSFYQQSSGEICVDAIVEDGETTVVRETSVDSCEPVDWLSVNLVTL